MTRVDALSGEHACNVTSFDTRAGVERCIIASGNNEPASAQTLTGSSTPLVLKRKEA